MSEEVFQVYRTHLCLTAVFAVSPSRPFILLGGPRSLRAVRHLGFVVHHFPHGAVSRTLGDINGTAGIGLHASIDER